MGANRKRRKKKQISQDADVQSLNAALQDDTTLESRAQTERPEPESTIEHAAASRKRKRGDIAEDAEQLDTTDAELALVKEARRARKRMQDWFPQDGAGVLLLGEGDFSFTLSVALRGVQGPIVATALDLEEELTSKYRLCESNLKALRRLGVELFFGVNATNLAATLALRGRRFSRIIFNFPHSGVPNYQKPSLPSNQELLRGIFISSASFLVNSGGQLRVTLRKDPVYHAWNIVDQSQVAFKRLMKKGAKSALCPVSSAPFPYHFFFGYRHVATVEDRAVDNPESIVYVFELQKTWKPPAAMVSAAENVDLSQGLYPCNLCNITFRSPKQLEMHEAGRRHQEAKSRQT